MFSQEEMAYRDPGADPSTCGRLLRIQSQALHSDPWQKNERQHALFETRVVQMDVGKNFFRVMTVKPWS